jgi:molybdopterin-guanine dinucleotide biosynthesis protein A
LINFNFTKKLHNLQERRPLTNPGLAAVRRGGVEAAMAGEAAGAARFPGRSAAILAGGQSSRMGSNKALLKVGGLGMLARTVELLRPLVDDLFICANDPAPYGGTGLRVVPDVHRDRGAIGGIHAAIRAAAQPCVLCVACDMPHLAPAVVRLLLGVDAVGADAVVPLVRGLPEPLLALYSRSALPGFERAIAAGRLRVVDGLEGLRVRTVAEGDLAAVDPGLQSFLNVNTPDELAAARAGAPGPP